MQKGSGRCQRPLAVMAVAAFLAFGLMATTGAQPVAAQDDADCELTFTTSGALDAIVHTEAGVTATGRVVTCEAKGGTATVKINGPDEAFPDTATEFVRFYIEDSSGALAAFAPGEQPTWSTDNSRYEISSAAASTKKYRFLKVDIPEVETNPNTGVAGRGSATFTVNKSKGGVVYIYTGDTLDLTELEDAGSTPDDQEQRGLVNSNGIITITFLGVPAIGEDLDTDVNKKLDDDIKDQCIAADDVANNNADQDLVGEATPNGNGCLTAGNALTPAQSWEMGTVIDVTESRSKLVVRTVADDDILRSADATPIIDGKMATHTVAGTDDTVTIYAVVEDENGEALLDTEVSFSTTTMPAGIVPARDLSDEVDTEEAVTITGGNLEDDQIRVTGLDPDDNDPATSVDIDGGDAVASYTLDSLPDDDNDSYRIEVVVTVGDLTLGTVVIAREGPANKIVAGVFNAECFPEPTGGDAEDFADNKFNEEAKGCDASGMARRFGAGETFVVKAHHEDVRDLVVGDGGDLSVAFANDDDDLLDGDDPDDHDDPVMIDDPAQAWVYTIHEDATFGDHMITVSTDVQNADDEDIASVTLTVTVAGPVDDYGLDGPDVIELGGAAEYTVTATDVNGGVPHFPEAGDNMVAVAVQPVTTLVTGLNASRMLELDEDTGVGTFTVYAALDAVDGAAGRIIVGPADNLTILPISFGAAAPEMLTAPSITSVMSNAAGEATITLTAGANATKQFVWAEPVGGRTEANPGTYSSEAAGDATSVTITGLVSGTSYWFNAIAGTGEGDASEWSTWGGWFAETPIQ